MIYDFKESIMIKKLIPLLAVVFLFHGQIKAQKIELDESEIDSHVEGDARSGDKDKIQSAFSLTKAGIELQKINRPNDALKLFDEALKLAGHPKIKYFKALSLISINKSSEAYDLLTEIKDKIQVRKYKKDILAKIEMLSKKAGIGKEQKNKMPAGTAEKTAAELSDNEKDAEKIYQEGKNYQSQGQYDEAIKSFRKAIEKNPQHYLAINDLGFELEMKGLTEEAFNNYKKCTEINPSYAKCHDNLGFAYKKLGKPEESKKEFTTACSLGIFEACGDAGINKYEVGTADYYYQEGKILRDAKKYDDAIESFKKAVEKDPKLYLALNDLGFEYEMKGKIEEALKYYQNCAETKPEYAKCHDNMGFAYKKLGKLEESKKEFTRACDLGIKAACADIGINKYASGTADYYYTEGKIQREAGKYDAAVELFRKAVEKDPNYYLAFNDLGFELERKGLTEDALKNYQKCASIKPDFSTCHDNMGFSYKKLGRMEEAKKEFKKACDLGVNDACGDAGINKYEVGTADYYYQEGKILKSSGKYDDAIESFKKTTAKDPNHYMALNDLGFEYEMKGMTGDALKNYQECIRIKPSYAKCYDNLGFLYKKLGNQTESRNAFQKACSLGIKAACEDAKK
jgi:tetratricopeptide (TPR) repeat protein